MTHRVVAVGATGHIGRPLCRELVQAGSLVTVFSRNPDHAQLGYQFRFPVLDAALRDLLAQLDDAAVAR